MRAIDGDVLRDRLQNLGYDDWNQGTTTTWAEAFNECADMVDEAPTIEPQRKKGRWILVKGSNGKDYHKCSECLHTQEITGVKNYCAVCGAEMTEDSECLNT